ncbi:uncharacterized protein LOC123563269 [Mercenaria mercenaria]|uniref:uncharacterized protein LOC123563269 n=1 Tax=Mercenaria mercenaria TaxID=6596 RepID=UPI001E1D91ED|nr:uncharacterized protein LOC123563269 [Mercenaria mercenaria]XP_045211915.1 uncharacterized protein LOC123563269 [Mercenaria mercenaria]XP_045211916.1 uncharacterized protein LOC123563269 [Mercenaria mercenaria]
METCIGLVFYIETAVLALLFLLVVGVLISKCLGYLEFYRPRRRRRNYVDLEKSTERSIKDNNQVDKWIQNRLKLLEEIEEPYENQRIEIESLQEQLRRERTDKKKEVAEKEDALKRLSAIMSSRLKDGNPNIADLNDHNRPTKIGEQFSELYDNQWTDAYGAVQTCFKQEKKEPEIIGILLGILEQCFMFCKDKANTQLADVSDGVKILALVITKKDTKLQCDLLQRIKEERKMCAEDELPRYNEIATIMKEYFTAKETKADFLDDLTVIQFTQECLKLCWLMVIQDPPMSMVLKHTENAHDDFKAYKHRGKHVSFVVWPALLLEEGGSLISKGIAEFHE